MSKNKKLVSIIIPVYNEAKTLQKILSMVYKYKNSLFDREIIIVESNSNDGSRDIVKIFSNGKNDVKIILQDKPSGKGHAVREGINNSNGQVILIQDADLEYSVLDYTKVLSPILEGRTEFVLGSRHLTPNGSFSWKIRKFKGIEIPYAYMMNLAGIIIHGIFNSLYGTKLTDPTTMYKVFTRKLYNSIHPNSSRFDFDWELVCKFVRLGYIPIEVPVKYTSRSPSEGKKISLFRDGYNVLGAIIKYRFTRIEKL